MDFLVYSRAIPEAERPEHTDEEAHQLNERHWSYMDKFADRMTARGPTLGPRRDSWTGSMHIVDLADTESASTFVQAEPFQQTGLYAQHSVWRFTNLLGRTMWEYPVANGDPLFLVLACGPTRGEPIPTEGLSDRWRQALVLYGSLSTLAGDDDGIALAVQVPSRETLDVLVSDPDLALSDHERLEVHDWEFGGRR
jgi:uncharacterized protein YciI